MTIDLNSVFGIAASATVALSGASVDFTAIPSWVKRIDIAISGMGSNGINTLGLQIGSSAGVKSTGYLSTSSILTTVGAVANATATFALIVVPVASTSIIHGVASLVLQDAATNQWSCSFVGGGSNAAYSLFLGGSNTLPGVLDRIRLLAFGGDVFNAGSARITYYG